MAMTVDVAYMRDKIEAQEKRIKELEANLSHSHAIIDGLQGTVDKAREEGRKQGMEEAAEIADKFVADNLAWKIIKGNPLEMVSAIDAIREAIKEG